MIFMKIGVVKAILSLRGVALLDVGPRVWMIV